MLKVIYLTGLLMFAGASYAASEQVPTDRTITQIRAYDNMVFVMFTPGFTSTQGCPNGGSVTVVIDTSNELGKNLYSAALAAASANRQIGFGVNGCHSDRPKVYRVDVLF